MTTPQAKEFLGNPKHKELKELIKAYIEGKPIQVKCNEDEWMDTDDPFFMVSSDYRIKPEPKIPITTPFGPLDFHKLPSNTVFKNPSTKYEYFVNRNRIFSNRVTFFKIEGPRIWVETYSYEVIAEDFFYVNQQGELVPCHHVQLETPDEK